jgi:hypothetical protein
MKCLLDATRQLAGIYLSTLNPRMAEVISIINFINKSTHHLIREPFSLSGPQTL